ncbi:MAG: hypothetical protein C4583_09200 [Anaerolineaceae bacterium]|nr:MAG: hypothetical protein C4583_09200 [Anaerolineaceae bacterium]
MKKAFDYPENWTSESKIGSAYLAPLMHKYAVQLGISAGLLNAPARYMGWEICLQSTSFNVKFNDTDYGCQIEVYIFGDNDDALKITHLWKLFVDKGIVWGGPYTRTLEAEQPRGEEQEPEEEQAELSEYISETADGKRVLDTGKYDAELIEKYCYLWVDRGYISQKDFTIAEWLSEHNSPVWLTRTVLYDNLARMYKDGKLIKAKRQYRRPKK